MKHWFYFKKYESSEASLALFFAAIAIFMLGLSYISVPIYQIFCQTYGIGGTVQKVNYIPLIDDKINTLPNNPSLNPSISHDLITIDQSKNFSLKDQSLFSNQQKHKLFSLDNQDTFLKSFDDSKNLKSVTVYLSADNSQDLPWSLKPSLTKVKVYPGDTALIFYVAQNLSDLSITGVATYNIVPAKAGIYFNKIQCFCFEEQRLKGNESIELPVLFFIDSDFLKDPKMNDVDSITLSYTFFKTNDLFL